MGEKIPDIWSFFGNPLTSASSVLDSEDLDEACLAELLPKNPHKRNISDKLRSVTDILGVLDAKDQKIIDLIDDRFSAVHAERTMHAETGVVDLEQGKTALTQIHETSSQSSHTEQASMKQSDLRFINRAQAETPGGRNHHLMSQHTADDNGSPQVFTKPKEHFQVISKDNCVNISEVIQLAFEQATACVNLPPPSPSCEDVDLISALPPSEERQPESEQPGSPPEVPTGSVLQERPHSTRRIIQVLKAKLERKQQLAQGKQQQKQQRRPQSEQQQYQLQQHEQQQWQQPVNNQIHTREPTARHNEASSPDPASQKVNAISQTFDGPGTPQMQYSNPGVSTIYSPASSPVFAHTGPEWSKDQAAGANYNIWSQSLVHPVSTLSETAPVYSPPESLSSPTGPGPALQRQTSPSFTGSSSLQYHQLTTVTGPLDNPPTPSTGSLSESGSVSVDSQQHFGPQQHTHSQNGQASRSSFSASEDSNGSPPAGAAPTGVSTVPQGGNRKRRRGSSSVNSHTNGKNVFIKKIDSDLSGYRYLLETPTSTYQKMEEDRMTYVNKGQFYSLTLDYNNRNFALSNKTVRSVIMVLFRDSKNPDDELKTWEFWHSRQHSDKQKVLDIDMKKSTGVVPNSIEEVAHNAVAIHWNPGQQSAQVNIAVNCLSTDFSDQKGIRGLPLHVQVDTYEDANDEIPVQRDYCQIKVFSDRGAERKSREEARRRKNAPEGTRPQDQLHPIHERSEFYSMADVCKSPFLFNPSAQYQDSSSTHSDNGEYVHGSNASDYGDYVRRESPSPPSGGHFMHKKSPLAHIGGDYMHKESHSVPSGHFMQKRSPLAPSGGDNMHREIPSPPSGGHFVHRKSPLAPSGGDYIHREIPSPPSGGHFVHKKSPLAPSGGDFIHRESHSRPTGGGYMYQQNYPAAPSGGDYMYKECYTSPPGGSFMHKSSRTAPSGGSYIHRDRESPSGFSNDYGDRYPKSEYSNSTEDTFDDVFEPPSKIQRQSSSDSLSGLGQQHLFLYVREHHESTFTALFLKTPTLHELKNAVEKNFKVPAARIKNIYKRLKKCILVKMDDSVIGLCPDESMFIIDIRRNGEIPTLNYDVIMEELDI